MYKLSKDLREQYQISQRRGMSVERRTIPDVRIDENTIRRSIIDAGKVKECAMEIYWRLKEIEDIIADEESEEYSLDRLRNLIEADRAGRCVVLPVMPVSRPGVSREEIYILSESGEIVSDNVNEYLIGINSDGKLNCILETFDCCDFESNDLGKTVFLTRDAAEAALNWSGKK